uniref:Uncharacterized protein n=1 Tax=Panagrolaimus davidi TaxID=227884 RepID=A0A914Q3M3_9BILA
MYTKHFFYIFVLNNLFLIFAENEYPPWKKAVNKEMLPNELKDVYDFEDSAVIIRGYEEEIPYVIEKDVPLKFQICREKPEKCEHVLEELKIIQFCYKALIANANDQINCPCGTDMGGFNIEEQDRPDKTIILVRAPHGTENEHVGIKFGECVNAEIVKEKDGNYELNFPQIKSVDVLVMNPLSEEDSSFEGNTNLRKISLHISSTNKVCGFYFKFINGFFPLYEWIDPPTTTLPTPPPSTKPTTATTMKTKTTSLPTILASFPTAEEKEYTTKIVTITDKSVEDVSESSLILWILIGVGAFIIVALIIALIVWCCIRHKFKKPSKKSLSDKKIPEQNQQQQQQAILPPSSTAAQCNPSSEAYQKPTPFIEKQQKNKDSAIKKVSNIKSYVFFLNHMLFLQ